MADEMRRIILFSGTTEGRLLSERLAASGIPHTVCVATEYGEVLQTKSDLVRIEEGRKTREDMERLFSDGAECVVDATHPFATEVTANIRAALEGKHVRYLRVLRELQEDAAEGVTFFDSPEECAAACDAMEGNVLFTTGSRDLAAMCEKIVDRSRVYVRVLPSAVSIEQCIAAGIRQDHILALQGPFSEEMNLAMIRQYGIRVLVTKESGRTGGVDEKMSACRKSGIPCLCIRRPVAEEGISVEAAAEEISLLTGTLKRDDRGNRPDPEKVPDRERTETGTGREGTGEKCVPVTFHLIGVGMGDPKGITLEADHWLRKADVCFGAGRLLESVTCKEKYPYFRAGEILDKTAELLDSGRHIREAVVLFSGDTGFYSGAESFEKGLKEQADIFANRIKAEVRRYPGISCVSALSARLGESYSDAEILSLHGRCSTRSLTDAVQRICRAKKSFVLFSSGDEVAKLAGALRRAGCNVGITVGQNLSYPEEKIITCSLEEAEHISGQGLYTAMIKNPEPQGRRLLPYLEDDAFLRDRVPMTKALIRHESIRMLELREGDVMYDVGGGTGSVSIEAACLSDTLSVYAFERKKEAVSLFRKNVEHFGLENITLVEGEAPEAFAGLPAPDAVFIGGSAGRLQDILAALLRFGRSMRVVITAVTLETLEELMRLDRMPEVSGLRMRQISCGEAEALGAYHVMKTENTVTLASFVLGERDEERE